MKAVIMAGGSGTRLWPLSRQHSPKQSQAVIDRESMVQQTFSRLRGGWPAKDIFVSTNIKQYPTLRRQLPQLQPSQFILEPQRRDTAAAIGLALVTLWKRRPHDIMFTVSSDHFFRERAEYLRVLKTIERTAQRHPDRTILLGIKPTYPHTGLGYIKMKAPVDRVGRDEVFSVERFIEKPNETKAKKFVAEWQYLWNIGVFCSRVDVMLEKYKRWLPDSYTILMRIAQDIGTARERATIKRWFPRLEKISIDYGIMEHDKSMLVVPADLTWADIGSWREVYDMLSTRQGQNIVHGRHVTHDSSGNLVFSYSGKLIATAGVHDMIIVETPDAILVCPRHRAQDVKHLVAEIERQQLKKYL